MANHKTEGGIRIRVFNGVLVAVGMVLAVFLLLTALKASKAYNALNQAVEDYISCQKSAVQMQAGSDYLTAKAQAFAVTGEKRYVDEYFEEAKVTKRREKALDELKSMGDEEAYQALTRALESSNELMDLEYYSMRLMVEGKGLNLKQFPEEIQSVTLTNEEHLYSDAKKQQTAINVVFDETYQQYKDDIKKEVERCLNTLVERTKEKQQESSEELRKLLISAITEGFLLLGLVILMGLCFQQLVIRPLVKSVEAITLDGKLPETGAHEFRVLSGTYNHLVDDAIKHQEKLAYEATHDPLTGLFNRGVFEKAREEIRGRSGCMILLDLDRLKTINDTHGHEIGDRTLKRIGDVLSKRFRHEDFVCRIGGDEFAVVMGHVNASMKEIVLRKILDIQKELQEPFEDLPPFTVSIGVCFNDWVKEGEDIYKNADKALYSIKHSTRNAFAFYEDLERS